MFLAFISFLSDGDQHQKIYIYCISPMQYVLSCHVMQCLSAKGGGLVTFWLRIDPNRPVTCCVSGATWPAFLAWTPRSVVLSPPSSRPLERYPIFLFVLANNFTV
ncbi:hypothetical protein ABW19_dt0204477 [Dactylella cylindrospora]|nr:hypothetical protein ABW19_dt0204477 [Dactylella cylindrospora]